MEKEYNNDIEELFCRATSQWRTWNIQDSCHLCNIDKFYDIGILELLHHHKLTWQHVGAECVLSRGWAEWYFMLKIFFSLRLLFLTGLLGSGLAQVDDFSCPDEFEGFYPHLYRSVRLNQSTYPIEGQSSQPGSCPVLVLVAVFLTLTN